MPADVAWPCMLELLTVLPQEAESNKIAIRPERRRRFEGELAAAFGDALAILSRRVFSICTKHTVYMYLIGTLCSPVHRVPA